MARDFDLPIELSCELMITSQPSTTKSRPWIWILAGVIGFFIMGGWAPLFEPGWWYGMTRDSTVGNSAESIAGFVGWLFWGPLEGFVGGFFLLRWLDKRKINASGE